MPSATTFRVIAWLVFQVFLTRYDGDHRVETSPASGCYSSDENTKIRVLLLILHVLICSPLQTYYLLVKGGAFIIPWL
jgi:hypothetical protein